MQTIRSFPVNRISVDNSLFLHLVPARGARLCRHILRTEPAFHIPENIVVYQVDAVPGAFYENRFPLFQSVQEQVPGDSVVFISHIHPQMVGTEGPGKNIASDQAVDAVMYFDAPCFPGKLHFLPAGSFYIIVLNQQIRGKHARDAADSHILYFTASDHRMADHLIRIIGVVPAFISDIDPHAVGPVNFTVLNNPVVSPITGYGSPLGNRGAGGRVSAGQPLHPDVRKERHLGSKALLPAGKLYQMLRRIPVILQTEMHGLSVGLHPIGTGRLSQLIIQRHLL